MVGDHRVGAFVQDHATRAFCGFARGIDLGIGGAFGGGFGQLGRDVGEEAGEFSGMGGSIDDSSQGSEGVSCTLPSGTSADCSFGPKDAYCEVTTPRSSLPARTTKSLLGDSTLQPLK